MSVRLDKIIVENDLLSINNGGVYISNTKESNNSITGSLITLGGIAINSSADSISCTSGGALTIGGGVSINKSMYIGNNLILDNINSILSITGISEKRLFIDTIANKHFYIAPDGINRRFDLHDSILNINISTPSTNSSSAALVIEGGVSINCIENSVDVSQGNALTIGGGVSISKDTYIGTKLFVPQINTSELNSFEKELLVNGKSIHLLSNCIKLNSESIVLNNILKINSDKIILSEQLICNKSHVINSTEGTALKVFGNVIMNNDLSVGRSIVINNKNNKSDKLILYSKNENFIGLGNDNSNLIYTSINNHIFKSSDGNILLIIKQNEIKLHGHLIKSDYNELVLQGNLTANPFSLNLFTADRDNTDDNYIKIYSDSVNHLQIGWNSDLSNFVINSPSDLNFNNNKLIISTNGSMSVSGSISIENKLSCKDSIIIKKDLFIGGGNIIFGDSGNTFTLNDNGLNINNDSGIYNFINNSEDSFKFNLYHTGSNTSGSFELLQLSSNLNYTLKTLGKHKSLSIETGESILLLQTSGNIGINTVDPKFTLDVNGSFQAKSAQISTIVIENDAIINGELNVIDKLTTNELNIHSNIIVNGKSTFSNVDISDKIFISNTTYNSITTNGGIYVDLDAKICGNVTCCEINSSSIICNNDLSVFGRSLLGISVIKDLTVNENASIGNNFYVNGNASFNSDININGDLSFTNEIAAINTHNGIDIKIENETLLQINKNNVVINSNSIFNSDVIIKNNTVIEKELIVYDNVHFNSTTNSTCVNNGSVVVSGGIGVLGNVNVLGNTILTGNLIVNGITTSLVSQNVLLNDNILVINSGPSASYDSGVIIQRYQTINDTGTGDVVNGNKFISMTIPDQTGMNLSQIKFPIVDTFECINWYIKICSGFSNNQVRKIIDYNHETKVAVINEEWTSQNPSINDNIHLYNDSYVGMIFNELNDRFEFGSTSINPGKENVVFNNYSELYCKSLGLQENINIAGICNITNTNNNSINTLGGITSNRLIVNNVDMTPNETDKLSTVIFNASNGMVRTNINNLTFDNSVWSFDLHLTSKLISMESTLYTTFNIIGVNKGESWELSVTKLGDYLELVFDITESGQLVYTSPDIPDYISLVFKYKCSTL